MTIAEQRRANVQQMILTAHAPITASELAAAQGVSRQVIVQDIALLRAKGVDIIATPNGYIHPQPAALLSTVRRILACAHVGVDRLREELMIIVEMGGKVVDVIVEHPIYGEYRGMLMIINAQGVETFIKRLDEYGVEPLSKLTGGVHLHTIEAPDDPTLDRIEDKLRREGLLVE